jgi:hypothetical protein
MDAFDAIRTAMLRDLLAALGDDPDTARPQSPEEVWSESLRRVRGLCKERQEMVKTLVLADGSLTWCEARHHPVDAPTREAVRAVTRITRARRSEGVRSVPVSDRFRVGVPEGLTPTEATRYWTGAW